MDVNNVLQLVDQLVFQQTGKHLDNAQQSVIKGAWNGETYSEIGKNNNFDEGHASNIGGDLWKILSEALPRKIKKTNFRATLEHLEQEGSVIIIQNNNEQTIIIQNNNKQNNHHTFNFVVTNSNQASQAPEANNSNTQLKYQDLALDTKIINLYNREDEFKILTDWIFNQNIRLTSVLGLSGIGKTILVKKFVDLNSEKFEIIIWKTLNFTKSLDLLLNDFLAVCQKEAKETIDEKLKQIFDILKNKKCLIILDDVQNIFISGELAGKYQLAYQNYQKFFKMIIETQHQSNVILISQESCIEMKCLDEELYLIKCLELAGLNDIDILKNTGLKDDQESWLTLIKLYEGNPFYLKTIVNCIKDFYDGNVANFLEENELIITQYIDNNCKLLFNKLSPTEQQIVLKMSDFDKPASREDLKLLLDLSSTDFINGLKSLEERYLVRKIKGEKILFNLSAVFKEYLVKSNKKPIINDTAN